MSSPLISHQLETKDANVISQCTIMNMSSQYHISETAEPQIAYNKPHLIFDDDYPYYFRVGVKAPAVVNPIEINKCFYPHETNTHHIHSPVESILPLYLKKANLPESSGGESRAPTHSDLGMSGVKAKREKLKKPCQRSAEKTADKRTETPKAIQAERSRSGKSPDDTKDALAEVDEEYEYQSDKKSRLRARNRKAAAKFRVQKKFDTEKLREKEETARELNKLLTQEASKLRKECLCLKNMVLDHAACGCPRIDEYMQSAAASVYMLGGSSNANRP
jgi:hypothetical protein